MVVWVCTGLVALAFDCQSPRELTPVQEPAVLPAPEPAYVVTLTICRWTWWGKEGTWMWGPFICSMNLLVYHVNDSQSNLELPFTCEMLRWPIMEGQGLHKGSEIWEAVQRSERMLRHWEQLRRKKSGTTIYRKGRKRVSGQIYLQPLLIGTWKKGGHVFQSPSSSADSFSLAVAKRQVLLFRPLESVFQKCRCLCRVPKFFRNYLELLL